MDNPAQPTTPLRPMNEPHLPITEAEMNTDPSTNHNSPNSKNTLLTLASLLVLAGIVGITIYLYIQNKGNLNLPNLSNNPDKFVDNDPTPKVTQTPEDKQIQKTTQKYGVLCKRFTSLEEALKEPEIACVIDFSGQELKSIPKEILQLTNITDINLSNNNLKDFPLEILGFRKLTSIDLSNNNLSTFTPTEANKKAAESGQMETIQTVKLDNNNFDSKTINEIKNFFGSKTELSF